MTMTNQELCGSLDALFAYDCGATDSGIKDERLRRRCIAELQERTSAEPRVFLARLVRDMWLSEKALARGYGVEDAVEFVKWLMTAMEVPVSALRTPLGPTREQAPA